MLKAKVFISCGQRGDEGAIATNITEMLADNFRIKGTY